MDAARLHGGRVAQEIGCDCVAVRVRLLSRAVTRVYDAALRPHGLTVAQLNLLTSIATRQPVPAGQVAALLSMEISTLSRNARLLQEAGLIGIERAGRGNGRVLTVTDVGVRKLVELRPAWRAAQRQAHELIGASLAASIKQRVDDGFAEPGGRGRRRPHVSEVVHPA
jgi:DNA-binding MarR family transcriptional regulator